MPQFGLRTIMLLIASAAVWTACYSGRKSIQRDMVAIEAMHDLAPELQVRNQNEYACLQINRMDDILEYQCYLPPGHEYHLHLQWSKDFDIKDIAMQPEASVTVSAGIHKILMNELQDKLTVSVDGEEVMNVPRKQLALRSSSSTGVSDRFKAQWHPLDRPLTLLRARKSSDWKGTRDRGPGIALWIELKE